MSEEREDDDITPPPAPPPATPITDPVAEILVLRQRLYSAELEVWGLRKAKHKHASILQAVMGHIELIKRDLDRLKALPGEVASLRERVASLESMIQGIKAALEALEKTFKTRTTALEARVGSLEPLLLLVPYVNKIAKGGAAAAVLLTLLEIAILVATVWRH